MLKKYSTSTVVLAASIILKRIPIIGLLNDVPQSVVRKKRHKIVFKAARPNPFPLQLWSIISLCGICCVNFALLVVARLR